MKTRRFVKIFKTLFFTIICVIAFKQPIDRVIFDLIINNIKYYDYTEGIVHIPIYKNYPEVSLEKEAILTLYKNNDQGMIEIEKKYFRNDIWMSSDSKMSVVYNEDEKTLSAIANPDEKRLISLVSKPSFIPRITEMKHSNKQNLIILSKSEFYFDRLKIILGVSIAFGFIVFLLVTSYFINKKIEPYSTEKKGIIIY